MSEVALKSQQVAERHEMLRRERINEATWPGKDLREIAVLQVTINNLEQRHAELVSAVRNASKLCPRREVFDESKDREFLDAMDKLEELVK